MAKTIASRAQTDHGPEGPFTWYKNPDLHLNVLSVLVTILLSIVGFSYVNDSTAERTEHELVEIRKVRDEILTSYKNERVVNTESHAALAKCLPTEPKVVCAKRQAESYDRVCSDET